MKKEKGIEFMGKILVYIKLFFQDFFNIKPFCRNCGRVLYRYIPPEEIIDLLSINKYTCYECFCSVCKKAFGSHYQAWKLVNPYQRKIEKFQEKDKKWLIVKWVDIKKGDLCHIYDYDGNLETHNDIPIFVAREDAVLSPEYGIWQTEFDPIQKTLSTK